MRSIQASPPTTRPTPARRQAAPTGLSTRNDQGEAPSPEAIASVPRGSKATSRAVARADASSPATREDACSRARADATTCARDEASAAPEPVETRHAAARSASPSTARAGPRSAGGTDGAGRDRAGRRLPVLGGVTAGLGAALFVGGPVGLVAGAVAGVAVAVWLRRLEPASVRRRREAIDEALPLAVDLLASCLAAGQAPAVALQQVTDVVDHPLRDELQEVATRLRLGADPIRVWRDVAAHPQLGSWGRTVLRAVDSGASVADAMAAHADDLRQASRSRVEARARAVGVRAALPLGVCLLPAFVLLGVVPLVAGSLSVVTLP